MKDITRYRYGARDKKAKEAKKKKKKKIPKKEYIARYGEEKWERIKKRAASWATDNPIRVKKVQGNGI